MTSRSEPLVDDVGWRILDALQQDARLSFTELGRRVGLSPPAVAERVRRLEDRGVIAGYRASIAAEKLFPIVALVRVSAPEHTCEALGARVRQLPEIIETARVTGDDRLVAKVVATSVAHLDRVIAEIARFGTPTASIVLRSRWQPVRPLPPSPVPDGRASAPGPRRIDGAPRTRRRLRRSGT